MAHYEGETLKERIERGTLGLDDAVDIAGATLGQLIHTTAITLTRVSGAPNRQ